MNDYEKRWREIDDEYKHIDQGYADLEGKYEKLITDNDRFLLWFSIVVAMPFVLAGLAMIVALIRD